MGAGGKIIGTIIILTLAAFVLGALITGIADNTVGVADGTNNVTGSNAILLGLVLTVFIIVVILMFLRSGGINVS